MKVTLNEVRGLNTGINSIMMRELPPPTANLFNRLIFSFIKELQDIDKERNRLAVKYAKKDKDGKPLFKKNKKGKYEYDLTKDNRISMGVEWDKINQKEIEIPFEPLKATKEVFGETITPNILYQLGKLIEE